MRELTSAERLPAEFTAILTRLFEDSRSGDYDLAVVLTEEEARRDASEARHILEAIDSCLRMSH